MSTLIRSSKDFWSVYHSLTPNRERLPHSLTNGSVSAVSPKSKANLLNSYFSSCFNTPSLSALSALSLGSHSRSPHPTLSSVECTDKEVVNVLRSLKLKTSSGPDVISSSIPSSLFLISLQSVQSVFVHWYCSKGLEIFKYHSCPQEWKQMFRL